RCLWQAGIASPGYWADGSVGGTVRKRCVAQGQFRGAEVIDSTAVKSAAASTAAINEGRNDGSVGQGLVIPAGHDEGEEPEVFVLTCHHVIAPIDPEDVRVRIPGSHGELGDPLPAVLVQNASDFSSDRAVLRLSLEVGPLQPTLYSLRPDLFVGP